MSSEIGVRLTGDNSEFRGMLSDSVDQGDEFAGKLAERVGDRLVGLRHVSTAVATAIGLNLENIGENIARIFTGMSKDEEEAFKKIGELSTQVTDMEIANSRMLMTEEQKHILLLQDYQRLQREIEVGATSGGVSQLRLLELRKQAAEIEKELNREILKQQEELKKAEEERAKKWEEFAKNRSDLGEKEFNAYLSTLETNDKILAIMERIALTEKLIAAGAFDASVIDQKRNELAALRNDLVKEGAKSDKEAGEAEKKRAEDHIKEMDLIDRERDSATRKARETAALLLKDSNDLTDVEKLRLEVLTGQAKQGDLDLELKRLTAAAIKGPLNDAERDRLRLLLGQTATANVMTDELKAQGEKLNSFQETLGVSLSMMMGFRSQSAFANTSNEVLEEMMRRNKAKIDELTNPFNPNYAPTSAIDVVTGHLSQRMEAANVALENVSIQAELNQRKNLGSQTFSEALKSYTGDLINFDSLFSKAVSAMGAFAGIQNNTNALLTAIAGSTGATAAAISAVGGQLGSVGIGANLPPGVHYGTVYVTAANGAQSLFTGNYKAGASGTWVPA